jgi:purine catabolism regulator
VSGHNDPVSMPADPANAITVAEALALPALRRGLPEVVAGHGSLQRALRWVHAGEVPNIAALLSGGELLLTTGMGLAVSDAQRRRFIEGLAQRGVAALVIELGTALTEIPESMREAAQANDLPLVALHREVPFVSVTEAVHTELVNRHYGLLRDGEQIRDRLIAVMLDGDGLPELLGVLSEVLGNPVFLQTPGGRLLFHTGGGDDLDAWESAGPQAGTAATVGMGPESRPGRLVVLGTRRAVSELDEIALRHAAGIVALALLRAREEDELVARERGNLLTELSDATITGAQAAHQAAGLGFAPRSGELLAIAISEASASPGPVRAALLADLRRELDGRATPVLCGARSADGPLLALVAMSGDRLAAAGLVADTVSRVWERRRPGTRTTVGVEGPTGWTGAGVALQVAAQTAAAAGPLPVRPWYDGRETELERLLASIGGQPALEQFVTRNLGPLITDRGARMASLRATLEVLCARGGHKAQAARELHLHRQALYHRISRIESLLGVDLSDPTRLTTLSVALRALPYLELTSG